jgi:hypothetical protein
VSRPDAPPTSVDPLAVRRALGRATWQVPRPFGGVGWTLVSNDRTRSVIISESEFDGSTWIHASIAGRDEMPTYQDLADLHAAVFGDRYAYQVFAPPAEHVNIHAYALHLWGRLDGQHALPRFGIFGTI